MGKKYIYLDTETGTFGADSGPGGFSFTEGILAPDNGDGADGDWYLRSTNRHFYHKVSGAWEDKGQLVPSTQL